MAIDDINYDITDLPDLFSDHLYTNLDYVDQKPDPLPGFTHFKESQLCVPQDPLEDLEWFPSFTDDFINLSGISLTPENETLLLKDSGDKKGAGQKPMKLEYSIDRPVTPEQKTEETCGGANKRRHEAETEESETTAFGFGSAAQKRQRSKRDSWGKHVWFGLAIENAVTGGTTSSAVAEATESRVTERRKRCSHCLSDKTPQWRMGPLGPKTLCNACGVRYKSGRLVPEYRPAASPTFDILKHSNFHKKIIKRKRIQ